VAAVFKDSAKQLVSNESRLVFSLPSTIKWSELITLDNLFREQLLRVCVMSDGSKIHLLFLLPAFHSSTVTPQKLVMRAIRAMIKTTLHTLNEEQRQNMLAITMRVHNLQSINENIITEGVSFKPNEHTVTLIGRFGANHPIDISKLTQIFKNYTTDGLLSVTKNAEQETVKGISPEGKICSEEGLLPLVLYADIKHESLKPAPSIVGKRKTEEKGEQKTEEPTVRKRGLFSWFV
jgi:hypothetical protein